MILETCYQLGQLWKTQKDKTTEQDEIQGAIKNALRSRRAYNIKLEMQQIIDILNICGKPKLYSTQYITLSNLIRLSNGCFNSLLDNLRIYGVHS